MNFYKRGKYEINALKFANHVIGRTDWDCACTQQINSKVKYHFCNETLRDSFYSHEWDIDKCDRNSIFLSQASTPIKGIHFMLQALPEIIKQYPKTHLYVAGNNLTSTDGLYNKLRISSFGMYIKKMIKELNLTQYVTFLGPLNEEQMCQQFLKSHVFVSPSTIENESNSLSEAKILGVPVVASYVGGVTNRITFNIDGYLYQHDAPYMLSYYVSKIFSDDNLALSFSTSAKLNARKIHNRKINAQTLIKIYHDIMTRKE